MMSYRCPIELLKGTISTGELSYIRTYLSFWGYGSNGDFYHKFRPLFQRCHLARWSGEPYLGEEGLEKVQSKLSFWRIFGNPVLWAWQNVVGLFISQLGIWFFSFYTCSLSKKSFGQDRRVYQRRKSNRRIPVKPGFFSLTKGQEYTVGTTSEEGLLAFSPLFPSRPSPSLSSSSGRRGKREGSNE